MEYNLHRSFRRSPAGPARFVVLCQPRTGSSLLNASLRTHPEIQMYGEILNHRYPHKLPQDGYQRLRTALAATHRPAVGCNLHAFQPDRGWSEWRRWESAWYALADDPTIKVIHLERTNILAQLASWKIAGLLNRWGVQRDIHPRPTIRIDPEEYRWFRDWNRAVVEWRLSHLRQHEIFPVTYESLCDAWDETIARIEAFVGVSARRLEQACPRNETRPLIEVVENFTELEPHLDRTCHSAPAGSP